MSKDLRVRIFKLQVEMEKAAIKGDWEKYSELGDKVIKLRIQLTKEERKR